MRSSKQRVAVIGGSGFIGTRLVRNLLASRYDVRIVDGKCSEAYAHLFVQADVRDVRSLTEACKGVDVIYNLAAVHHDDVRPLSLYEDVNVGGARNVCDVARTLEIEKIVFTSSVAIYGLPTEEVDENAPADPFNEYGRTKWEAEQVHRHWVEESHDRTLVVVRPTAVFGEGNRGNIYNLIRQVASGRFALIGDGTNCKSIAYVENVAAFLQYGLTFESGEHVYNYIDKPDLDMNSLVRTIRALLGRPNEKLIHVPYTLGRLLGAGCDVASLLLRRSLPISSVRVKKLSTSTVFSAEKLASTGFRPPYSIEEGLRVTLCKEFGAPSTAEAKAA